MHARLPARSLWPRVMCQHRQPQWTPSALSPPHFAVPCPYACYEAVISDDEESVYGVLRSQCAGFSLGTQAPPRSGQGSAVRTLRASLNADILTFSSF